MVTESKKGRGGVRPGAGAPLKFGAPTRNTSIALTDDHYTVLDEMAAERKMKRAQLICDILVRAIKVWERKRGPQ